MSDRRSSTDVATPAPSEGRRLRLALLGLAVVPAMAAVVLTAVSLTALLTAGDGSPASDLPVVGRSSVSPSAAHTGFLVGLALLAAVAAVVTIVLLRYLLQPLDEVAGSRSRLQLLYRQAHEDSRRDSLTGLGNQRAFQEGLRERLQSSEEFGETFAIVLIDLDDLKVVNDHEGHAAGDEMLKAMANAMLAATRAGDQLYRIGGDEFAMLLPGTEVDSALELTRRLLHMAWRPYAGVRPSPFSAGISAAPLFGRDPELLYRQADAALYWVKRHGRGAVDVFEPERDQLPDTLEDATRAAIQEVLIGRLLVPVFQPIVDLRTGRILGFEGLIRPDPSGPLPDATTLFAAAAACGRTVELDVACIEQVLSAARAIGPDRILTLNLSPRTLEVRDFDAGWLLQGLYRNGISPGRVVVELTERDQIDDLARLKRTFEHLRKYGLRIAADDVGAGNSGLRLLSQVQFDIVKLDLSLVQDGVRRMGARSVLQSLRDLALDQHAHVVAEGVETAQQLNVLRDLQIQAGQGYLLGRPGASVAATFVDVDNLGDRQLVVEPTGRITFATPEPAAGDGKAPQVEHVAQDLRIIVPKPRLAGLVGTSTGAA